MMRFSCKISHESGKLLHTADTLSRDPISRSLIFAREAARKWCQSLCRLCGAVPTSYWGSTGGHKSPTTPGWGYKEIDRLLHWRMARTITITWYSEAILGSETWINNSAGTSHEGQQTCHTCLDANGYRRKNPWRPPRNCWVPRKSKDFSVVARTVSTAGRVGDRMFNLSETPPKCSWTTDPIPATWSPMAKGRNRLVWT